MSRPAESELAAEATRAGEAEPLVEVEGLKTYYDDDSLFGGRPVRAVDGVTFDIDRGETLGLVGESGCGKSTLGRTLVALEQATEGRVKFDGRVVTSMSGGELKRWRRSAQIVFQDPDSSLNDRLTVGEIVREPLDVHDWPNLTARVEGDSAIVEGDVAPPATEESSRGADLVVTLDGDEPSVTVRDGLPLSGEEFGVSVDRSTDATTVTVRLRPSKAQVRRAHVRDVLETVGLQEEHYYRYPHQFSGGQRQRVGIARALALEPDFVVLDEPVSALDVSVQAKILNLLEDLQEQFGLTYLLIAHDLSVVRHICDRVAVMYLGNIMELGPTEELFEDPSNPYTYSLLSAIPEPDPGVEKERVTLRGAPPSPRYPPDGCPFSTRCPVKIRAEGHADLDPELYADIELLWEVIRERYRTDRSLRDIAKDMLGLGTRYSAAHDIAMELFGDPAAVADDATPRERLESALEGLPPAVRPTVEEALSLLQSNDPDGALEVLRDEFGSVCNGVVDEDSPVETGHPAHHQVSESGRTSLCHRHLPEYEEPDAVFGDVFRG